MWENYVFYVKQEPVKGFLHLIVLSSLIVSIIFGLYFFNNKLILNTLCVILLIIICLWFACFCAYIVLIAIPIIELPFLLLSKIREVTKVNIQKIHKFKIHLSDLCEERYFNNVCKLLLKKPKYLLKIIEKINRNWKFPYNLSWRISNWIIDNMLKENVDIIIPFLCTEFIRASTGYGLFGRRNRMDYVNQLERIYYDLKDKDKKNAPRIFALNGTVIKEEARFIPNTAREEVVHSESDYIDHNGKYDRAGYSYTTIEDVEKFEFLGNRPTLFFNVK